MTTARLSIINAFKVEVLAANPTVAIEKWNGEEAVFNSAHTWPCVFLSYAGLDFGQQEEFGATTYARTHVFNVFVAAASSISDGTLGDETAVELLENIEIGVSGKEISGIGLAELINEELVHAHMGRFLYVQTWKIEAIESH